MDFRQAQEADIPQINKLLFQVHKIHSDSRPDLFTPGEKKYSQAQLTSIISDTEKTPLFVLCDGDTLLGYAFCEIIRDFSNGRSLNTLYIDDLCVDRAFRGKGYGSIILERVKEYAKTISCYNITLNVWALNESALNFYKKSGMNIQKYGMEMIL